MEAFKPGTGPADSYWVIGMATKRQRLAQIRKSRPQAKPRDPDRRRRPVLTVRQQDGRAGTVCRISVSALYSHRPRPYVIRADSNPQPKDAEIPAMRAEIEKIVDEIKQAISLLRRHL